MEGGEGSGKTTQAKLLAQALGARLTREPGGTELGARIRALVLDPNVSGLDRRTEALLMAADRSQHVAEVIGPALSRGEWVVSDRFSGSTFAYQGFGRGLDLGGLRNISDWASKGLVPELNVLLDVPAAISAGRRCSLPDRLEAEDATFHSRVVAGYLQMARADPGKWAVVDGDGSIEEVAVRVLEAVIKRVGSGHE